MAFPAVDASSFDVFLSFRGEDIRHSFADHLYQALKQAGFLTFRDEEEIRKGEELRPEIVTAITGSKASVVVLSENYATSSWCLDELLLILQQRREFNHFVLPVFYHVDPSDIRKHSKTFAIEVKDSHPRWTDENVKAWKTALTEVADLSGEVSEGHETMLLQKIVDVIYNKLDHKKLQLPYNLTGMTTRYDDISSFMNDPNHNILAICGMGGSGKTTLAKYIYNSNCKSFEYTSYVDNIGSKCKGKDGLLPQMEKLLHDILGGKNRQIPSVSEGTPNIEKALKTKRALIVLDNIVEQAVLLALLGSGEMHAESKIIITTTVLNIKDWFNSKYRRCCIYEMRLLSDIESCELLCLHALRSKFPKEGFQKLAVTAVGYCEGNPLALEVLGRLLEEGINSIPFWESALKSFEKNLHDKIGSVLIESYNSLPLKSKELFLHIACFFVGIEKDYVEKILEPDFSAISGIKTLINRSFLSVSPNKKLMMPRLLQELGKDIAVKESKVIRKRSRVWHSHDSYKILRKGKGSETMEGLAIDMKMLREAGFSVKSSDLRTDALREMDKLKLLQLNFVQLAGSYDNFSEDLRWLCCFGFPERFMPSSLFLGELVAIDMSYSKLIIFEPPTELTSLKILNFKDSENLQEIRNISRIPHLQILILWNCHGLVHLCKTIRQLTNLELLNMTGCKNLSKANHEYRDRMLEVNASAREVVEEQPIYSFFPHSLDRLFLKGCNLVNTNSFPPSFSSQPYLRYLNLGNSLFEFLPCYNHLKNLLVLDLSFCERLKKLLGLPCTLAELYVYHCESLEMITFEAHQFSLQEFGYKGCISLAEVEGLFKLVPIAKLTENDLGHMKWLKEYQNMEVRLIGDDELTKGRSSCVQMLYEFNKMSTSLPYIMGLDMKSDYKSTLSSFPFDVPLDPKNRRLKGLDVTFRYRILGDDDYAWFCKISTINGVDLIYNPKVFGKPESGLPGIWLSYWPIGSTLNTGDIVTVSIVGLIGLEVEELCVSLVYADDEVSEQSMENSMEMEEVHGGDPSRFQLSTGANYLCRRDLFQLMEVGRLNSNWFRNLVGDSIDVTEVRGWRNTGRPEQSYRSLNELKTVSGIIHGPESEEVYKIAKISKSSFEDKTSEFTSSLFGKTMKSATSSKSSHTLIEGDSDWESTSVSSSIQSSSSTSSLDQESRNVKGGTNTKKLLKMSNSKKMSFMSSRRRLQSRLTQSSIKLSDDDSVSHPDQSSIAVSDESSNYVQKSTPKFTRTGSLRSVKIFRTKNKNKSSLKSNKSATDTRSEISEEYHGHHHHHVPPSIRFSYLKRGTTNDRNTLKKSETRSADEKSSKKREPKLTKRVSEGKDDDFSIEFYAKTRSEPVESYGHDNYGMADILFGVNSLHEIKTETTVLESRDFSNLNEKNDGNLNGSKSVVEKKPAFNMWHMIHRHMVSGLEAGSGDNIVQQVEEGKKPNISTRDIDDAPSQEIEIRKMFAIKLVSEAIEKILLPEVQDDQSTTSEVIPEQDLSEKNQKEESPAPVEENETRTEAVEIETKTEVAEEDIITEVMEEETKTEVVEEGMKTEENVEPKIEKQAPNSWSRLKKLLLLRKFVKELEKVKKFNPKNPTQLLLPPQREHETFSLRRQNTGDKKNADEWMLDYALQKVVSELAPTQKRKVALLVKAFETVVPVQEDN